MASKSEIIILGTSSSIREQTEAGEVSESSDEWAYVLIYSHQWWWGCTSLSGLTYLVLRHLYWPTSALMQTGSFLDIIHLAAYHSSCMGPYMNVPSRSFPPRAWAHSIRYRWFVTSSSVERRYYHTIRKSLLGFDKGFQHTKTSLLWVPYAKVMRVLYFYWYMNQNQHYRSWC